jgi:Chitin binding Peritrophin-A domain
LSQVCINGEPIERRCTDGLWFNFIQQRCTQIYETRCELDEAVCYGIENDVMIRGPSSCSDFITCTNGIPRVGRCWGDLFFNERSGECEPREQVECDLNVSTEDPTRLCEGKPDFSMVGSLNDCREYFVCYANEQLERGECFEGHVFDFETQVCGDFECFSEQNNSRV